MINIAFMPPSSHKGCAISTISADAEGMAYLDRLRGLVRAFNKSKALKDRLRVRTAGRLGKKNPAYKNYVRHYCFVRNADATRFDVYIQPADRMSSSYPEQNAYIQSVLIRH